MPYASPQDYTTTFISDADGWLIATRADMAYPGASSGMIRPPMTDETASVFGVPPEHEGRVKYMATLLTREEDQIRYADTFDAAVAFIIENT